MLTIKQDVIDEINDAHFLHAMMLVADNIGDEVSHQCLISFYYKTEDLEGLTDELFDELQTYSAQVFRLTEERVANAEDVLQRFLWSEPPHKYLAH
jgi:hypothetical protein